MKAEQFIISVIVIVISMAIGIFICNLSKKLIDKNLINNKLIDNNLNVSDKFGIPNNFTIPKNANGIFKKYICNNGNCKYSEGIIKNGKVIKNTKDLKENFDADQYRRFSSGVDFLKCNWPSCLFDNNADWYSYDGVISPFRIIRNSNLECNDCINKYPNQYMQLSQQGDKYPVLTYRNKMNDPYFDISRSKFTPGVGYGNYRYNSLRPKRVRSNWYPFRYQTGPWSDVLAKGTFNEVVFDPYNSNIRPTVLHNVWLNLDSMRTNDNN